MSYQYKNKQIDQWDKLDQGSASYDCFCIDNAMSMAVFTLWQQRLYNLQT